MRYAYLDKQVQSHISVFKSYLLKYEICVQDPNIITTPKRLAQYAALINKEIHKLKYQVERVLEMSSMENNQIRLNKELINIHDVIISVKEKIIQSSGISESCIHLDL